MGSLLELNERIAERMEAGSSLDEVEAALIDPQPLSDDEKAALWLFAWSFKPVVSQRAEARRLYGAAIEGYRSTDYPRMRALAVVSEAVSAHERSTRQQSGGSRRADQALYRRVREALKTA